MAAIGRFATPVVLIAALMIGVTATPLRAQTRQEVQKNLELFQPEGRFAGTYRSYRDGRFALDDLPGYRPKQAVSGWIRIHGDEALAGGKLARYWEEGFARFHPKVHFSFYLAGTELALTPLYYHRADVSIVHELGFYDILPYERIFNAQPLRICAFTGSFDVPGHAPPFVIIVNRSNPLTRITVDQLDGIFGAARDGGWVGTAWRVDLARGKDGNIRSWDQMGLAGAWAGEAIRPHGFNMRSPVAVSFNDLVMKAGDKWNEKVVTYGPWFRDGKALSVEAQLIDAVAADRYAVAYTLNGPQSKRVKVLPVASGSSNDFVTPTLETVRSRRYPFFREGAMYINVPPNGRPSPLVEEFVRYVLSREGQREVQRDGKYLPLDRSTVEAQRKLVDSFER